MATTRRSRCSSSSRRACPAARFCSSTNTSQPTGKLETAETECNRCFAPYGDASSFPIILSYVFSACAYVIVSYLHYNHSCSPPGYDDYFNDNPSLPDSYWSPMVSTCTPPYPQDGSRERGWPEQFWNCAEVTISPSGPSPPTTPAPVAPPVSVPTRTPTMPPSTRAPTMPAPTTPSPVAAPTPFNGNGCCSWSLPRSCDPPDQPQSDWCNANASQCEGGCSGVWVSSAPTASPPTRTPTVSPPVANPTQPPVSPPTPTGPSDFCCSWDRLECQNTDDDWCQASQDRCEGSCSGYWIDPSEPVTCLADWQPCLDDPNGCCDGLQCVGNQWYMQCKPVR